MLTSNIDRARLKALIEEARTLHKYTLMSDRADHLPWHNLSVMHNVNYRLDFKEAWDFVRKVAKMEIKENE